MLAASSRMGWKRGEGRPSEGGRDGRRSRLRGGATRRSGGGFGVEASKGELYGVVFHCRLERRCRIDIQRPSVWYWTWIMYVEKVCVGRKFLC